MGEAVTMKRRKGLRRTRFKRKLPDGTRAQSADIRNAYLRDNPICEWGCGRRWACEVHHIIQKAGGSYETIENYLSTCRRCHDKCHAENLRQQAIEIKVRKGEWFESEEDERAYFGRLFRGCS